MITLEQFQDWDSRLKVLKKLPHRPVTLLAATWAYRVLPIFERQYPDDNRPRQAIAAATQCAVEPTKDNQQKARGVAHSYVNAYVNATAAAATAYATAYATAATAYATAANAATYAATAASYAAYAADAAAARAARAADAVATEDFWPWLCESYAQCLDGGREWSPQWATPEAVAIARRCALELEKSDLPYLADALEDAGYPHEADLERLRSGRGEWSDWPVWNVLLGDGKIRER